VIKILKGIASNKFYNASNMLMYFTIGMIVGLNSNITVTLFLYYCLYKAFSSLINRLYILLFALLSSLQLEQRYE
jgi:hypothetical protein